MVGDVDKGRSNTEQLAQELKEYCLDPWLSGLRIELKRKLFPSPGIGRRATNRFFVDFDLTDLLRPDAASREKFNASGRQWGYLSSNDVRALEKLNPIDDPSAEKYWMPVNMTLTDTPLDPTFQDGNGDGNVPPKPGEPPKPEPDDEDEPPAKKPAKKKSPKDVLVLSYSRLFTDAFRRIVNVEKRVPRHFENYFGSILFAIRDMVKDEACGELRVEVRELPESDVFIASYLRAMSKRGVNWKAESTKTAVDELDRAITAIRIAVFREVATEKAAQIIVD
jgi:hypothetical protein